MPVLQRAMEFSARRHDILANNVANANTPYFTPSDLKAEDFHATLTRAMESRDRKLVKTYEPLGGAPVREEGGRLVLEAQEEHSGSLMFHDHSKMSVEKEMTRVTKNALYHAQMTELMKKEITQIRAAITGRSG